MNVNHLGLSQGAGRSVGIYDTTQARQRQPKAEICRRFSFRRTAFGSVARNAPLVVTGGHSILCHPRCTGYVRPYRQRSICPDCSDNRQVASPRQGRTKKVASRALTRGVRLSLRHRRGHRIWYTSPVASHVLVCRWSTPASTGCGIILGGGSSVRNLAGSGGDCLVRRRPPSTGCELDNAVDSFDNTCGRRIGACRRPATVGLRTQ